MYVIQCTQSSFYTVNCYNIYVQKVKCLSHNLHSKREKLHNKDAHIIYAQYNWFTYIFTIYGHIAVIQHKHNCSEYNSSYHFQNI